MACRQDETHFHFMLPPLYLVTDILALHRQLQYLLGPGAIQEGGNEQGNWTQLGKGVGGGGSEAAKRSHDVLALMRTPLGWHHIMIQTMKDQPEINTHTFALW